MVIPFMILTTFKAEIISQAFLNQDVILMQAIRELEIYVNGGRYSDGKGC